MKDLSDVSFEEELIRLKLAGDPIAVAIYLRSHGGWYPAQIADYLGVSRQTVYRWTDPEYAERQRILNRHSMQERRKNKYVRPERRKKLLCPEHGPQDNWDHETMSQIAVCQLCGRDLIKLPKAARGRKAPGLQ